MPGTWSFWGFRAWKSKHSFIGFHAFRLFTTRRNFWLFFILFLNSFLIVAFSRLYRLGKLKNFAFIVLSVFELIWTKKHHALWALIQWFQIIPDCTLKKTHSYNKIPESLCYEQKHTSVMIWIETIFKYRFNYSSCSKCSSASLPLTSGWHFCSTRRFS